MGFVPSVSSFPRELFQFAGSSVAKLVDSDSAPLYLVIHHLLREAWSTGYDTHCLLTIPDGMP